MPGPTPPHCKSVGRTSLFWPLVAVSFLCTLSFLLGVWNNDGGASTSTISSARPCITLSSLNATTTHLDFAAHHYVSPSTTSAAAAKSYPSCAADYTEYTPCEDQKRSLKFPRDRLIYRERHCPRKNELLKCRIPAPSGYKLPFRWPASRDLAWYANVPHKELTVENWIRFETDRFRFPGGGTYIDDIGKLIDLNHGSIRTALDTGCGVASWGAHLLSRNILTMSFAPRDTHVQFALERGIPALIGVMASKQLPYPSRSFDMAHCSGCLIPWGRYDGAYLMEVDRVLRPGGYWILSGPPIRWREYWRRWERSREDLNQEQTQIENITKSLCWKKIVEKDDIAIWQKPANHNNCIHIRKIEKKNPPFCNARDPDNDKSWYTTLETCLTPLPEVSSFEEISGGAVEKWPERLNAIPPRISRGTLKGVEPKTFRQDTGLWKRRVSYYKTVDNQLNDVGRYRNILDMNAFLGGFAASLIEDPVWVMNVVPVEAEVDTLGVIYERGLIGTYQSWCEAMSTYPRTYDLIHADSIFTLYEDRCEMEDIMLEMDRILRPEGSLIIRDDGDALVRVKRIADGLNWDSQIVDHEDGPMKMEKLLFAVKVYSTVDNNNVNS